MSSWLQFDSILLNQYVLAICELFPSLSSIDELFNLASEEKLDDLVDFRHLQRYSKIVSILTTSGGKSALLRKGKEKGILFQCVGCRLVFIVLLQKIQYQKSTFLV